MFVVYDMYIVEVECIIYRDNLILDSEFVPALVECLGKFNITDKDLLSDVSFIHVDTSRDI